MIKETYATAEINSATIALNNGSHHSPSHVMVKCKWECKLSIPQIWGNDEKGVNGIVINSGILVWSATEKHSSRIASQKDMALSSSRLSSWHIWDAFASLNTSPYIIMYALIPVYHH